ncbi:DUF5930 domain-containing protein [Rhodobacteraceae bacterium XHP0102]|nr:DUF5930 domain-containing protein [Rhodobacteraceae bacterium XHP0102]
MKLRLIERANHALDRYLPEKRLFLKSDTGTRFVRLRPLTQAAIVTTTGLLVTWTAIVTAVFFIDAINAGSNREQVARASQAYQERLNAMSHERDSRAMEAQAAHERFGVAMTQVSAMQSQLLASEERRRELETAVNVIQSTLRRTIAERDDALSEVAQLSSELSSETGQSFSAASRQRDLEHVLALLTEALEETAEGRDTSQDLIAQARSQIQELEFQAALSAERNERIFTQIEDAVAMSLEPLDAMFRAAGLPTDSILETVRRGYSGQGGPLTPITFSTSNGTPDPVSLRANDVLEDLDAINLYRIAAESLPFTYPVIGAARRSSGFGYRRDPFNGTRRMHEGVDFAGPVGTPLVAAADGVVTFAGRRGAYGNMIEIRHTMGYTTRYAHLSRIRVNRGETVSRGDRIGDMGNTGRSTGSHLHYEVRLNGTPINPMTFITAGRNVF